MIILLWWLAGALWEWVAVIVCIMIVLSLELLNTALENLLDYINPKFHPLIGTMKDMTAGAVLVGSVGSIAVGLIIIVPKFVQLFSR
jgi:diacylglycerol kinase